MKKAWLRLFGIWLLIVIALAVYSWFRIESERRQGIGYGQGPDLLIDGKPGYWLSIHLQSECMIDAKSLWSREEFGLLYESELGNSDMLSVPYWTVMSIDPPYGITIQNKDGEVRHIQTMQIPKSVDARWNEDGTKLMYFGGSNVDWHDVAQDLHSARVWNDSALRGYLSQQGLQLFAVTATLVLTGCFISIYINSIKSRGRCIACGYDLRGLHTPGCPECGAGRKKANP